MTDREKLIEILRKPIFPHEPVDPTEAVADYLLDNGVIVPPCKVGDKVYTVQDFGEEHRPFVDTGTVFAIGIDQNGTMWVSVRYECGLTYYHPSDEICETVFLSREEAEAHLPEPPKGE